jgi:hypothetical protein
VICSSVLSCIESGASMRSPLAAAPQAACTERGTEQRARPSEKSACFSEAQGLVDPGAGPGPKRRASLHPRTLNFPR